MKIRDNQLYLADCKAIDLVREYGSPLYVYEEETIRRQYHTLAQTIAYRPLRILYACKANTNLAILKILLEEGAGIDAVSPGEVFLARQAGYPPDRILYTGYNASQEELAYLARGGVMLNLDSFTQMRHWARLKPGARVSVRINPGVGSGHHQYVVTAGEHSKFGIDRRQHEEIKSRAKEEGLTIIGLQSHIGSGILDAEVLLEAMALLLETARHFPDLEFIDIGGGLGVPYRPGEEPLDIAEFGRQVSAIFSDFCASYGRELTLMLEPGRYLVAESGYLLVTVNDIKHTPNRTIVGVDSGFNHLIRPVLYGAYHPIINACRVEGEKHVVTVAGNICENGDIFAQQCALPPTEEGDILAITHAGAYGFSMASRYNSRPLPAEVLVKGSQSRLIRHRESLDDLLHRQTNL
ncbi:MAG: diaminopimelate decarboxylase [Chloroflexi bacterium]|nr:diaminopimelate decarboxylase [Chloroflexota bacterium]